ncbi:hypothetical protein WA026_003273 [Henosepilachna vigintioctopunctata]|uniref:Carboxylesterase type B domain-containing protein n=1 Tax=Henosepilachna vigintioctopunctata TaxID=420089 RepID=A0AAW1TQV0_9CUCU
MIKMAKLHSEVNQQSYFYVFKHKTTSKEYLRDKTSTGDELPYMLGVPLDTASFHFVDNYTEKERLFSELIMTYICNFAYSGNPNYPRKNEYYTHSDIDWSESDVDWPEYDGRRQRYLQLDIPLKTLNYYREKEVLFWNDAFPKFLEESKIQNDSFSSYVQITAPPRKTFRGTTPFIFRPPVSNKEDEKKKVFGRVVNTSADHLDRKFTTPVVGTVVSSQSDVQRANAMNIIVISGSLFLFANFLLFMALYYKCYKLKKNRGQEMIDNEADGNSEGLGKKNKFEENQAFVANGCGIMNMISKSSKSDDVYEAVRIGDQNSSKYSLARQLSNSTIDAHTKVKDWITQEINHRCSPKGFRKFRQNNVDQQDCSKNNRGEEMISLKNDLSVDNDSTLGKSSTRPVSPATSPVVTSGALKPILVKQTSLPNQGKKKRDKVSVAIDATPSGRGPSVLAQQPIELTKSLDYGTAEAPLRRSITLEDFSPKTVDAIACLTKSANNLSNYGHLKKPTFVKINHSHSKSDPVQDTYAVKNTKKLKTFAPSNDVNVTSCDEKECRPLSPEESLQTIKRRNFPKVLPDYPNKEALAQKRRSMPAANLSIPGNDLRNRLRIPPAPPTRTTSTLGRKPQTNHSVDYLVCTSAPVLLEEGSSSPEPELTYNNLYVGPLIPKKTQGEQLDTNPIYSSLNALKKQSASSSDKVGPVAIVTTDPDQPLKKPEPKTVIRPKMSRQISDPKIRHIPRVTATDNLPGHQPIVYKTDRGKDAPTMIPISSRNQNLNKPSSESETSPSEESDTGTVVKRVKDVA